MRIAESRSLRVVVAPRIEAPPVRLIFVLVLVWLDVRAGEEVRLLLLWRESEIRGPAAEGGNLEGCVDAVAGAVEVESWSLSVCRGRAFLGSCCASGSELRARVFDRGCWRLPRVPLLM